MFKEPRESAPVRILLASRNIETIEFLCQQTHRLSMHVETACDADSAMRKLCHSKFEGLIVDFEFGADGLRLLGNLPGLTSNRRAISFAIVADESDAAIAFRAHTTFVFQRPLAIAAVARTFRAAQPMMFRERRRDYRYPIEARTFISSDGSEFLSSSVNLSETGIALNSPSPLKVGAQVQLRIELPRMAEPLVVSGEVCWSDTNGRAGIHFLELRTKTLERLQQWLSERMSELVPGW
jgi:PilZ domain-containing protein